MSKCPFCAAVQIGVRPSCTDRAADVMGEVDNSRQNSQQCANEEADGDSSQRTQQGRATGGQRGNATRAESAEKTQQGGSATHFRGRVDIGPVVGEVGHDAQVAVLSGNVGRRRATLNASRARRDGRGGQRAPDQPAACERRGRQRRFIEDTATQGDK